MVEVGEQGWAGGGPAEALPSERAGGGDVEADEHAEPAEVCLPFFRRQRDDRQFEAAAERLGDVAQGDAFWWGREDILELREPFAGFRRIVRGFDRDRRGVVEREFAVSVDGGAGQGGRLIAVCFSLDGTLVDIAEA